MENYKKFKETENKTKYTESDKNDTRSMFHVTCYMFHAHTDESNRMAHKRVLFEFASS